MLWIWKKKSFFFLAQKKRSFGLVQVSFGCESPSSTQGQGSVLLLSYPETFERFLNLLSLFLWKLQEMAQSYYNSHYSKLN